MSFGTYKMDGYRTHKSLKNDNGEIEITQCHRCDIQQRTLIHEN